MRWNFPTLVAALMLTVASAPASQPKSLADMPDPAVDAEKAAFIVPDGFEVNLWASEPMLHKPVQMNWDARGRLWVVCSQTYPQIKPGEEAIDQVVVLEDTNRDGKADKSTVFADGLLVPTAVMPGDGGCYVANSTEILFLKDTNGDGRADVRETILSGFGTEDTHHLIHTFRWTPEGMLSFNQSIYIHSHVETPWGVRRLMGGGVWEFRTETRRLEVFCKGLVNAWGREFDKWGQTFLTDGAGSEGIHFAFPQAVFKTSPGAKRTLEGLNPGQPKHAGIEIVDEPHFPDDWQGTLITCDFRGNRINRFQLAESGSGYLSKQLPDVLASRHPGFRPIDVRTGPDGALYVADWYNPIIQHGEVDFRDPRRDHTHGRIWRLTVKGRPLGENPDFSRMDAGALLKQLDSNRRWNRLFARREMRDRAMTGSKEVGAALQQSLDAASKSFKAENPSASHLLLEHAWAIEGLNARAIDSETFEPLLLNAKDHRVRAAALRILSQHIASAPHAMRSLQRSIADEHPQVRLWAVACLNLMQNPEAFALALRALDKPVDNNIDFLLDLTAREQADTWLPAFLKGDLKLDDPKHLVFALKASGRPEALQPLLDAFAANKLSPEDSASVLAMVGDVATPAQLDQILNLALARLAPWSGAATTAASSPKGSEAPPLLGMLDALIKAGQRGSRPSNVSKAVTDLLSNPNQEILARAALLAGAWKLETAREQLAKWASQADASPALRQAAVRGLTSLGGLKTRDLFDGLSKPGHSLGTRILAINGMSEMAPQLGAKRAAEFLSSAKSPSEAKPVIEAFIKNKQLPQVLAKELEGRTIPEAVAVEGIRIVSSRGIKGPLEAALQKAGNIRQMNRALTPDEMNAMIAKVNSQGDPARGEQVYRRQQLLCFTCHAIGGAGGALGPDIVSLGAAAPVDYIIESMLEPSKKIKEGFNMTMLTMKDGQVMAGMIAQDGPDAIVLRDAGNQLHKLAKSNIARRETSPISMMPPGLTATLREDEFIDLIRFLSELGKEGEYKIKPNRFIRAWRAMGVMDQVDIDHVRHTGLQALSDRNHAYPWLPAYSGVSGAFPLGELSAPVKMYPWFPRILQCDLQMDGAGKVKLKLSASKNVIVAVGDKVILEVAEELTLDLPAGRTPVSFIITRDAGDLKSFSVEIIEGAAKVATGM